MAEGRKLDNDEERSRLLREKGLSFFGAVTASLSHEINNVLSIINELSGLLDDLLLGAEGGRPLNHERLAGLSEKIGKNVKKGEALIKRLNRFAHSIDEPVKDFDLKELLNEIGAIAQRLAFLKGARLETRFPEESITLRSNPFSLQHAVFICIELALATSAKDDVITLTCSMEGPGAEIGIAAVDEKADTDSRYSFLSILVNELGGNVEIVRADDDTRSLILSIPKSINRGQPV